MTAAAANQATGATLVAKVVSIGADKRPAQTSNALSPDEASANKVFQDRGAIAPPYDPDRLAWLFEQSSALRQNVDAYATNIDGFGHRFEPVIDMDAADVDQRVAQTIIAERVRLRELPGAPAAVVSLALAPTPEEVQARKGLLVEMMRAEKVALEQFFDFCSDEMSFVSLRRKLRQDLETTGNGYFETLRNGAGRLAEFVYLPATSMRLMPLSKELVAVKVHRKVSDTDYETLEKRKRFRLFLQVLEQHVVFFKEYGDPRTISRKTGAVMPAGCAWEEGDGPATEVMHFKVHSSRSAYGIPRWMGVMLPVLGNRQAEEVNYAYFDNKSVPPMAILVSGGTLTQNCVKAIEDHINNEIKGKGNFHKILVIEAQAQGGGGSLTGGSDGTVKVEIVPLTDAQQKDALFMQYDERNMDKVGQAFRLPRLLRGDIRDFNRATAEAALEFAEQQVFGPEREDFDFLVNRKVLSELRIRFWKFKSNAPSVKDPTALGQVITALVLANVLTPQEARELSEGVFNRELKNINAPWVHQPVALTLAGLTPVDSSTGEPLAQPHAESAEDEEPTTKDAPAAPPLVTRTAMGYVTTVNEARTAYGLPPMAGPSGEMTLAEWVERAKAPSGRRAPTDDVLAGTSDPARAGEAGDLSLADLQRPEGQLALAQGRRLRRMPRKRAASAPSLADEANRLLALRETMREAEARKAADAFFRDKVRELRAGDVRAPEDVIRALVPIDLLKSESER